MARSRARRCPIGLLGAILLIAGIESTLAWNRERFATVTSAGWSYAAQSAEREAPRAAILCLGDSLVKHGIDPQTIERRAGQSTFNLGLSGGQAPAFYFLLRSAIDSGARPAAILVDGDVLDLRPRLTPTLWAELASLGDGAELAYAFRDIEFFGTFAAARALPSVRGRDEIRRRAAESARIAARTRAPRVREYVRGWQQNDGAQLVDDEWGKHHRQLQPLSDYWPTMWSIDPMNWRYLARFFRLAADRGIPVYWLIPPVRPEVQDRRERAGRDYAFVEFSRALQRQFANVTVVDGRHAGFDAGDFLDWTHLNRRGAVVYSEALADVLTDRNKPRVKTAARWVSLPALRDLLVDPSYPAIVARRGQDE
jgi:hypothetical protein